MKYKLQILITSSDMSNQYNSNMLDKLDKLRLQQNPQLSQRPDWCNSRFLKQQLSKNYIYMSLAHKKGQAALIASSSNIKLGIDLEYAKNRDFIALSQFYCTKCEQHWLAQQNNLCNAFYLLWTLKEALIKAHHGQLADMLQWSLIQPGQQGIRIPAFSPQLQAYTTVINQNWYVSIVYPVFCPPPHGLTNIFGLGYKYDVLWQRWPIQQHV